MNEAETGRAALWRRVDGLGVEYCALTPDGNGDVAGWTLAGTAVLAADGRPVETRWRVVCDGAWRTRLVMVELVSGEERRALRLEADGMGRWLRDGVEIEALRGCLDVDLGVTPATNTLPIRRLALADGEGQDLVAAWIRFPALTVEPLPQHYTRLDARHYRYESRGGAFTADLTVDDAGLVTRYPGGWERIAEA